MIFDQIYAAAITQNSSDLNSALQSGCIDEWKVGESWVSVTTILAKLGEFPAVEFLISNGANINYAIHGAAEGGHQSYVENLLARGACSKYAVYGAAKGGHLEPMEILLKQGAYINDAVCGIALRGDHKQTDSLLDRGALLDAAVQGAALGGHKNLMEDLLTRGASINLAVFCTALAGYQGFMESLLERGAKIDYAVQGAGQGGQIVLMTALLDRGANRELALMGVAQGGFKDSMEPLLDQGFKIDYAARGASQGGHLILMLDLLKRGANINLAVSSAVLYGHNLLVETLLNRGANINQAALEAANQGHQVLLMFLLDKGGITNKTTLLFTVAFKGHKTLMKAMLARGISPELAITGAQKGGHQSLLEVLIAEHNANIDQIVLQVSVLGHQSLTIILLDRGASIEHAMCGAILGDHQNIVDILLQRGANIHKAVKIAAAWSKTTAIMENMLKNGADINEALKGAAYKRNYPLVENLWQRGADIDRILTSTSFKEDLNNPQKQMEWLVSFQPEHIPALIKKCNGSNNKLLISLEREAIKRAVAVSKCIHRGGLNQKEAATRTDKECQSMLYLLVALLMKHCSHWPKQYYLPLELWYRIFNFITPEPLEAQEFEHLAFINARTYLRAQLSCYQSFSLFGISLKSNKTNNERSLSFFNAVTETKCNTDFYDLVNKQADILQGINPYPVTERNEVYKKDLRTQPDEFHTIIKFWKDAQIETPTLKPTSLNKAELSLS